MADPIPGVIPPPLWLLGMGSTLYLDAVRAALPFGAVTQPKLISLGGDVTRDEGNAGQTVFPFVVQREGDVSGVAAVPWAATLEAPAGYTPILVTDFFGGTAPTGTVNFAAGETQKGFSVSVVGNAASQPNRAFKVTITPPGGVSTLRAFSYGLVMNDDPPLAADPTQQEPVPTPPPTPQPHPAPHGHGHEHSHGHSHEPEAAPPAPTPTPRLAMTLRPSTQT